MTVEAPLFPVEIYNPTLVEKKPDTMKYIVGRNTVMLLKPSHFGHSMHFVESLDGLPEIEGGEVMWLDTPKLPAALIGQAWDFFAEVWNKHKAEAMVFLTYNKDQGYKIFIPQQTTTGVSVAADFALEHIAPKHRIVGTIHSHCDFDAYHSGTDQDDARRTDGLHMTIGHVNTPNPSTAVMISSNKTLFEYKLEDIMEGTLERIQCPPWWHRYVNDPKRVVLAPKTIISHSATSAPTTTKPKKQTKQATTLGPNPTGCTAHSRCSGNTPSCKIAQLTGSENKRTVRYECMDCGEELDSGSSMYCLACTRDRARPGYKPPRRIASDAIKREQTKNEIPRVGKNARGLEQLISYITHSGSLPAELAFDPDLYTLGMEYLTDDLEDIEARLSRVGINIDFTFSYAGIDDTSDALSELYTSIYGNQPTSDDPAPF